MFLVSVNAEIFSVSATAFYKVQPVVKFMFEVSLMNRNAPKPILRGSNLQQKSEVHPHPPITMLTVNTVDTALDNEDSNFSVTNLI